MLFKLPKCFISRWTHSWRMNQLFYNIFNPMENLSSWGICLLTSRAYTHACSCNWIWLDKFTSYVTIFNYFHSCLFIPNCTQNNLIYWHKLFEKSAPLTAVFGSLNQQKIILPICIVHFPFLLSSTKMSESMDGREVFVSSCDISPYSSWKETTNIQIQTQRLY